MSDSRISDPCKAGPSKRVGLRQTMAGVHTWAGLSFGWLLYFVFVTGTAGYLDTEIDRWMRPELPVRTVEAAPAESARAALKTLRARAVGAQQWYIGLPNGRDEVNLRIFWIPSSGEAATVMTLDPASGAPIAARATGGGQLLYRMHYDLHYLPVRAGWWIVGVATMAMLVALLTGVVVHRRFFADFFTFRPGRGQRSWLDAHNVSSVITLPFQLMITVSGFLFFAYVYLPLIVVAQYGVGEGSLDRYHEAVAYGDAVGDLPALLPPAMAPEAARITTAPGLMDLAPMLAVADGRWGPGRVSGIVVHGPDAPVSRVILQRDATASPVRRADALVFDASDGRLLADRPVLASPGRTARDVLLGLHEGLFAGPLLRALYVLSGLLGAAMIATGLVLWTAKRRQRLKPTRVAPRGLVLLERLNVGAIVGLPIAIAAFFWANRLLPVAMSDRAAWEAHVLFAAWAVMLLHAALRPPSRGWREQFAIGAIAFGLLPVLNALTTTRHLGASLAAGDHVFAGFDLAMLGFGVVFAMAAWWARRRTPSGRGRTGPIDG